MRQLTFNKSYVEILLVRYNNKIDVLLDNNTLCMEIIQNKNTFNFNY